MNKVSLFDELKRRITSFVYKPGQVINVSDLSREFKVSTIPIREALIRLEEEKLIELIPHRGAYVKDLSFQELRDVFEVRIYLLGLVAKLSVQRIKKDQITEMKAILEKMKKETDRNKIVHLDAKFHYLLNNSTDNLVLVESLEKLRNRLGIMWYLVKKSESYSSQIPQEIEKLIKALEDRDEEKSKQILEEHAINFLETIKDSLSEGYWKN
jgi:DNA-binding GntR family transcriptional regulator